MVEYEYANHKKIPRVLWLGFDSVHQIPASSQKHIFWSTATVRLSVSFSSAVRRKIDSQWTDPWTARVESFSPSCHTCACQECRFHSEPWSLPLYGRMLLWNAINPFGSRKLSPQFLPHLPVSRALTPSLSYFCVIHFVAWQRVSNYSSRGTTNEKGKARRVLRLNIFPFSVSATKGIQG